MADENVQGNGGASGSAGDGAAGDGGGAVTTLTKKDFTSDQEVRWCPGCGDYAILAAMQTFLPELAIEPHNTVFVSGIGCSSRFPYYLDTYGIHGIHGRAPAIATGVAAANPKLAVWVITGDGDGLSIGGNHLIHALRRNVNIKIVLFNNQIYGLTKGQYSPTSELGKVTKSTPFGSLDHPFNPVALALGAEASFVARSIDVDRKHLTEVFRRAAAHRGAAFIEVYQNCNIFNDGAFEDLTSKDGKALNQVRLEHGKPIIFGPNGEKGVRLTDRGSVEIVDVAEAGQDAILIHDEHREEPSLAFMLAHMATSPHEPTPIGIFRDVERAVYGDAMEAQIAAATANVGPGDIANLLRAGDTWEIG